MLLETTITQKMAQISHLTTVIFVMNFFSCFVLFFVLGAIFESESPAQAVQRPQTFTNPLDLPYRFSLESVPHREAADPTVVYFHDCWWLFASKSGGYWYTSDFHDWKFVEPTGLPIEDYAPTVEIIHGRMYYCAEGNAIYSTDDPIAGTWFKVSDLHSAPDADLFEDSDGRTYLYYGCSNVTPIYGEELDPEDGFKTIRGPFSLITQDRAQHGWEVTRQPFTRTGTPVQDKTNTALAPWIEGSWMNKVDGRYYLQYAAPGTELDGYGDGVYVGDKPFGPFTYMPASPFSYKPTGFIRGAGHGSTFKDTHGNYWHIATAVIGKRAKFERRLVMFPVKFFDDGQVAADTYLGDYPQYLPGEAADPFHANSPGWMLLSLNKPVTVSSTLTGYPASNAVDESVQDWWSASTGNSGEWLQVDLGAIDTIEAVQINFADQGANHFGRLLGDAYQYLIQVSDDGTTWRTLIDKSDNQRDSPHDYTQLTVRETGRFVRVTNVHCPASSLFSISGLRIFGNSHSDYPDPVRQIVVQRAAGDGRCATIYWKPAPGAEFYIVRYGIHPNRLYSNYQVYGTTDLNIYALNAPTDYYFTVDSVNSRGVTKGPPPLKAAAE
jgi:xylan 1,4-beta-xylosidase